MCWVVSHRPSAQAGGRAGRPVSAVQRSRISFGVGPWTTKYSSDWSSTLNCTWPTDSEPTS